MIKNVLAAAGALLMLISLPHAAVAEDSLTRSQIEKFLDTWDPLQKLGDKYALEFQNSPPPEVTASGEFNPFLASLSALKTHKAYGEFMNIIKKAGFTSGEEWANTANRIMQAYMSTTFNDSDGGMTSKEISDAIAEVESNPHISAEQKKAIVSNLKNSMAMLSSMKNVSEADRNAIKPYMDRIEKTLKEEAQ